MTVLILADDVDPTADAMVRELATRRVTVCRLNTERLGVTAEPQGDDRIGYLRDRVALADITSVWFRTPSAFGFPEQQMAQRQPKFGLGGALASLPVLWVNHPARVAVAVDRPAQLVGAAGVGLAVSATLVRQAESDNLANVELTMHQPRAYDVRVIVIGDEHWAVSISSDSAAGRLDFRGDHDSLHYELVSEPADIHDKINRYMARFDLRYGAFDFVVDHEDAWWFLECNPGGQYGWLERATGAPITASLARVLAAGRTP
jgi:hypothetical protein